MHGSLKMVSLVDCAVNKAYGSLAFIGKVNEYKSVIVRGSYKS